MAISESDLQFIEQQLGRKPRGILEISARNKTSQPVVVKTSPVIDDGIFPTLYYLVERRLIDKVSKLEATGLLAEIQQKVDTDENFRAQFLKSQEKYRQERNNLVDFKKLSESRKEALNTGIGGVKDLTRVKCLHCHLAHYLATKNNPVGEIVNYKLLSYAM